MADDFFVKKMLVSLFSVNGMGQKGKCTNFAKLNMAWTEIFEICVFIHLIIYRRDGSCLSGRLCRG